MSLMPGWYQSSKPLQSKAIEEFATNRIDFSYSRPLEIQTAVDHERSGSGRRGNSSEAGRIDTEVSRHRSTKVWMVQDVRCIHPEFKFLGLCQLYPLRQVHIQIKRAGTRDPLQSHRA